MKFLSVRDFRNSPGKVWKALKDDDFVVTANGKPVGLLIGVPDAEIEASMRALQRARAAMAVSRMRGTARAAGADRWTPRQVDAEIARVRRRKA
jgi:hypothetical protein